MGAKSQPGKHNILFIDLSGLCFLHTSTVWCDTGFTRAHKTHGRAERDLGSVFRTKSRLQSAGMCSGNLHMQLTHTHTYTRATVGERGMRKTVHVSVCVSWGACECVNEQQKINMTNLDPATSYKSVNTQKNKK